MAFLRAFGSHLPSRRIGNDELAPLVGVTPEWILEVSGISERRYAADDETVVSLGLAAARNCLGKAAIEPAALGMILVASGSAPRFTPGAASQIAAALGLAETPALDIPVASAGSLIGLALASQLASKLGPVLVIGAETMSRAVERTPEGKDTAILFGDGGGACLVDPDSGIARIADFTLYTDGSAAEVLKLEAGRIEMNGMAVIRHAGRRLPQAIQTLLDRNSLSPDAPAVYLLHQANRNLIHGVANKIKVPRERFFTNLDRYGNTSAASLLIAADEWFAAQTEPVSAPLVFAAFGTGLNWGALLALPA
jgi:3-oxoacyl-[acyl-carrier-protein] synthase III